MSERRNTSLRRLAIGRTCLGVALLLVQVVLFARARFVDSRYFCWAPFHSEARYRIDVTVRGRPLDDGAIAERYRIRRLYWDERTRTDWELNAIAHVIDTVRATEEALPSDDRASVVVTYRVNGRGEERWQYR
jgi:hypothetical protein